MKLAFVGTFLPLFIPGILLVSSVLADDIPAPRQKAGNHFGVPTTNGDFRDDELVEVICGLIQDNGGKVKDVKVMVNSCYGGGLLDDLEKAFGPDGPCEGIPWVAGSASGAEQTAQGASDATVLAYPEDNFGSSWTDALAGTSRGNKVTRNGVIREGSSTNNVMQDLQAAGQNDHAGPNGEKLETPQVASGNGGDQIMWNMDGAKHEAIIFGGNNNRERHHKNIENMKTALENTWPEGSRTIQTFDGGSKEDLYDALDKAIARLDENTQLVIYIDDHGSSTVDLDEAEGNIADEPIEDNESIIFEIPEGVYEGMWGNELGVPYEYPNPVMELSITSCVQCSAWSYIFNGLEIPFEGGDRTGVVHLPIPWWAIWPGYNQFEIVPTSLPPALQSAKSKPQGLAGSLTVSRMQFSSGAINEQEYSLLKPGQSAAFYDPGRNGEGIFVELLDNSRALVYMFTYDLNGEGQAWMLGLGYQTGNGIIVNDLLMPSGATFGPDFNPDDVVQTDFGNLVFNFPTCGSSAVPGALFLHPKAETAYSFYGDVNYVQLVSIVDCDDAMGSERSPLSGSWYDPTHDGEGVILEILVNGTAVIQWFTYDSEGKQMWIQGTGTFDGNTLTSSNMFTTSGTAWGFNFNPADVMAPPWGSLTIEFSGCGQATLTYQSSAGFGEGVLNLQRITELMGIPCEG